MPEEVFVLIAFFGFGTFTLMAMRMWLNARIQTRQKLPAEEFERLADTVDRLHEEVRLVRDELVELHERVDFTERMLVRGDADRSLESEKPSPS
jgi:hypothetical protein